MLLRGQRVVRVRVTQFGDTADVAGVQTWHLRAVLALADGQVVQLLDATPRRVVDLVAVGDRARIDAEIRDVTDVGFGNGLEDLRRKGAVVFRVDFDGLRSLRA